MTMYICPKFEFFKDRFPLCNDEKTIFTYK